MNSTENCVQTSDISSSAITDKHASTSNSKELVPVEPLPPPAELPPEFKTSLLDIEVSAGSSTKFVVQLENASKSTKVNWYHNGIPVSNSDRHLFLQDGDFLCVQINQVRPSDAGQWICRAENPAGGMSCCCILHVTCPPVFSPPQFISGLRGHLWDNGTISLECEVKGKPTPSLRWWKCAVGTPGPHRPEQILEGASITIKASAKESETLLGIFACEAQNCMGSRALYAKVYAKNFCDYLTTMSRIHQQQKQIRQG